MTLEMLRVEAEVYVKELRREGKPTAEINKLVKKKFNRLGWLDISWLVNKNPAEGD